MAKDYVIRLQVDDKGAVQAVDNLTGALDTADQSATSLKAQLRGFQQQLASLPLGSKEFEELSKKAGQLKDQINDASEAVRANAGNAFESLSNNVGLLGERFVNLDFEGVGSSFKSIAATVSNFKLSDLTDGLKNVTSGFASLGKALLANPILLIGAAIAALVVNFDELKTILDVGVNPATRAFVEETKKASEASAEALKAFDLEERRLRALGVAEEDIAAQRKEATKQRIEGLKAELQAQNILLVEQAKAVAKANLQRAVGGVGGQVLAAFAPSQEDLQATIDGQKKITDQIAEFNVVLLELDKKTTDNQKNEQDKRNAQAAEASKKRLEEERKAKEEQLTIEATYAAAIQRLAEQNNKDVADFLKERNKLELTNITTSNDEKFKLLKDQQDLEIQLMEEGIDKEIAIADQKAIKLREQAAGNAELLKQIAEQNAAEVDAIQQKYADAEVERQKKQNADRVALSQDVLGSLINVVNSFEAKNKQQAKRQFNINKGLQIAQAAIQTYQNTTAAFGSQFIPGDPSSLPRAIGAAAFTATQGLLQIAKIKQTKFDDSGGGGSVSASSGGGGGVPSAGGSGGASGAPTFNPLNTAFLNNRPPNSIPAYVISGNVTSAQEADEKVKDLARL